ncbi:MAG: putative metalloprotease CJM1_0395 family protein, partial [Myxococcota bacterium]
VSGPPAEADAEATEASPAEEADADEETSTDPTRPRGADGQVLSDAEVEQIEELKARDREVRAHEQAHKAVGGQHAGAISYDYERGPDGRSYAVGGEVKIDISEVEDDHEATIRKMQQVRRAALAPSEPSAQDRAVAAEASEIEQRARTELRELRSEERSARQEAPESSEETAAVSGDEEASPYAAHTESYGGRVRVDLQASEALTRQRGLFTYRQSV